jgi:hypothetical protein
MLLLLSTLPMQSRCNSVLTSQKPGSRSTRCLIELAEIGNGLPVRFPFAKEVFASVLKEVLHSDLWTVRYLLDIFRHSIGHDLVSCRTRNLLSNNITRIKITGQRSITTPSLTPSSSSQASTLSSTDISATQGDKSLRLG